jgi:hypothetical protein
LREAGCGQAQSQYGGYDVFVHFISGLKKDTLPKDGFIGEP